MSASPKVWELRGANLELFKCVNHEALVAGPRDTGKTIACCVKVHAYCSNVPMCQGAIVRKTNRSLAGSVLKTLDRVIHGSGVKKFGGESPSMYIYPNGSRIYLGGMDNPDKVLSSERDFIYVNQAEELKLDDWEILAGSCSGRGAVVKHPQLFGDCNPAGAKHWLRLRAKEGKLVMFSVKHEDNPSLFDKQGKLLPGKEPQQRMAVLDALTGVRRKRLRLGLWVSADGSVYEDFNAEPTDPQTHVFARDWREMVRWLIGVDVGFTNPAVVLLVGEDSDGRWHIFREFFVKGCLPERQMKTIAEWFKDPLSQVAPKEELPEKRPSCSKCAIDQAAAGFIASCRNIGVTCDEFDKGEVRDGVYQLMNRIPFQADGWPRLSVDPSCVETINEFESYEWEPDKPKDTPKKENDHAMDALRYLDILTRVPTGALVSAAGVYTAPPPPYATRRFEPRKFTPRTLYTGGRR